MRITIDLPFRAIQDLLDAAQETGNTQLLAIYEEVRDGIYRAIREAGEEPVEPAGKT